MRLVYVITAIILSAMLLIVFLPCSSNGSWSPLSDETTTLYHSVQSQNVVFHIGSNLSFSDYYLNGNLDVKKGEMLSVVNVRLYVEGTESMVNVSGSVYFYNSTVFIGNELRNVTSLSLYGYNDSRASLTTYNSRIYFAGIMKSTNASLYGYNSTFGENQSVRHGSTFIFIHSQVILFKSRLTGLESSGNATSFETLAEYNKYSPVFNSGNITMSPEFLYSKSAISGVVNLSIEYSGNNPFNGNYLLMNVSGNTIKKLNFNNTGSVTQYSWLNVSVPVERLQLNGSSMESRMTVYYHYDPAKYSNTTIWNVSIRITSNDSVDRIGIEYFRDLFSNSSAYIEDSQLGINNMPFRNSYGNPNGRKDYALVTNNSKVYDYGVSYDMLSSENNQSAFMVSDNSSLLLGRIIRILAYDDGTPLNKVYFQLGPSEMNTTDYAISQNIIDTQYHALTGYGLFGGLTFTNGSCKLPVISNVLTGANNSLYLGDYALSINTQLFYFSVPSFPFKNSSRIYLNVTPTLPALKVIPLTTSVIMGPSSVISAIVYTNYPYRLAVSYELLFLDNGTLITSGNTTIDNNRSMLNLSVSGYNRIRPGNSNISLVLKSNIQILNGTAQTFTFPVDFIKSVSASINFTYSANNKLVFLNVTNFGNSSIDDITVQESEYGSIFSNRNFTGIDLKPMQSFATSFYVQPDNSANFSGKLILPYYYFNTLSNTSTLSIAPEVHYGDLRLTESGLPENYSWGVIIDGKEYSTTMHQINISLPAGSYYVSFMNTGTYLSDLPGKTVNVSEILINVKVDYIPKTASLVIKSSGLPEGVIWGVNVSGNVSLSGLSQITLIEPMGQYTISGVRIAGFSTSGIPLTVKLSGNTTVILVYSSDNHGPLYPALVFLDASYRSILIILFSVLVVVEYGRARSVFFSPLHKGFHFQRKKIK